MIFTLCISSFQFSSVTQSCMTLCNPMDVSTSGVPVHKQLPEFIHFQMPSNYLIFLHPLLLGPSIFPSMIVFSNESVLPIRWLKYWSFRFNISPSSEFRTDFLYDGLVGSPCSPRKSSPTP